MFKLKLKNALSYSGVVSANEKDPFVEVGTKGSADDAVATGYFDIVEVSENGTSDAGNEVEEYTAATLKKLNAEQQKEIIVALRGDLESVSNEEERIALILQLQEEQKEEEE